MGLQKRPARKLFFMETPFERAVKHDQYDLEEVAWAKESHGESTRAQFFLEYLRPYLDSLKGKKVLDIGAGTGWLVKQAMDNGAVSAVGLDPSTANIKQSKAEYPGIEMEHITFEEYKPIDRKFDVIVAVMSFSHIEDVNGSFKKVRALLERNGQFILVIPDFEYNKIERFDYVIEKQPIDEESYAVAIKRPAGTIADIIRKTSVYERAAKVVNMKLVKEVGMKPTKKQIARAPKYESVKDMAITRLLEFKTQD